MRAEEIFEERDVNWRGLCANIFFLTGATVSGSGGLLAGSGVSSAGAAVVPEALLKPGSGAGPRSGSCRGGVWPTHTLRTRAAADSVGIVEFADFDHRSSGPPLCGEPRCPRACCGGSNFFVCRQHVVLHHGGAAEGVRCPRHLCACLRIQSRYERQAAVLRPFQ